MLGWVLIKAPHLLGDFLKLLFFFFFKHTEKHLINKSFNLLTTISLAKINER